MNPANSALLTGRDTLVRGLLDLAEAKGAITPAERADFAGRLTTANAASTLSELPKRKAMPTAPVVIDGNRLDLTTANARRDALQAAVEKRMKADGVDYGTAFKRVKADPQYAGLFSAMKQAQAA